MKGADLRYLRCIVCCLIILLPGCGGGSFTPPFSVPAIALTPTSLGFPDESTGAVSAAETVTVTNTGTATLQISDVTLTGADFQEIDDCVTQLMPGATCSINVTFSPTMAGDLQGSISIADNAAGSPHALGLSGRGVSSPPPSPVLTGYCFGPLVGVSNKCVAVRDTTDCPEGRAATNPVRVVECLPPTSQLIDESASCHGSSRGHPMQGGCVASQ